MLIVVFVLGLIICFLGCFMKDDDALAFFVGLGIVLGSVAVILMLVCGFQLINGRNLEGKIALYEEENAAIEEDINILVEQYMKYEADTYESLKGESGITLVSLYPELKADTLVSQQCELYISNKEQIVSLKEQQIQLSSYRFWLYFGK